MSFDVFISYRHSQKATVLALCDALTAANITYFRDEERREDDASIQKTIENGLANSRLFLAWYDPSYLQSKACAWEFSRALLAAQLSGSGLQRIIAVDPSGTFNHILPTTLLDQARVVSGDDVTALIQHLMLRLNAISTPFGSIAAGSNAGWYERDRPTHPTWVGRAGDLIKLFHQLDVGRLGMFAGERAPVAITGWGGEGKTMLAQQYALRFAAAYPAGVVWLSGATADGVTPREGEWLVQLESALTISAIGKLALPINELLQGQTDAVQSIRILKEAIDRTLKAQAAKTSANAISPYLWIIDDLPDRLSAEQQQLWLPVDEQIHCLATIRESRGIDSVFHPFAISSLDEAEALTILTRLKPANTDAEKLLARQIIEGLGRLPLALSLAAVIISSIGYQQYVEFIKQSTTAEVDTLIENIAPALPSGHARSIVNTFLRSLQQVADDDKENSSEADKANWLILRLIALLAPITVPDILLTLVLENAGFGNKVFTLRVNAITNLHQAALIKREGDNADQSGMHALMARTVLEVKTNKDQQQALHEALLPAMEQWIKQEADKPPVESDKRLLDVASKLCEPSYISLFSKVILDAGNEAIRTGSKISAKKLIQAAYGGLAQQYGKKDLNTLAAMSSMARSMHDLGDFQEAYELNMQVLEIRREVFGDQHPDTLKSMNNIALTMRELGDLKKAYRLQKHHLKLCREVLGEKDTGTLESMSNLALIMYDLKDLKEAYKLQSQVLELRREVSGEKDNGTIVALNNLALTIHDLRDLKEAYKLQSQALELGLEVMGEKHTDTLSIMHNLASTLCDLGDFKKAYELEKQVVELCREVSGEKHPFTLMAMNNLAIIKHHLGDFKESYKLLSQALELCNEVFGKDHANTLMNMENSALILRDLGDLKKACELQKKVFNLTREKLGGWQDATKLASLRLYDTLLKISDFEEIVSIENQIINDSKILDISQDGLKKLFDHLNGEREKHNISIRDFGKP